MTVGVTGMIRSWMSWVPMDLVVETLPHGYKKSRDSAGKLSFSAEPGRDL